MGENATEEKTIRLTPDHIAQIRFEGLYKGDPEDFRQFPQAGARYWDTSGKYHCTNWCFSPHVMRDGRVFMVDNYWSTGNNTSFEITDSNFDMMWPKFKLVMEDRSQWQRTDYAEASKYDPADIVYDVASGSGGYTCASTTWKRIGAKPVVSRELAYERGKLEGAIRDGLSTWSVEYSMRIIDNLLAKAEEEGVDVFGTAEKERIEGLLEGKLSDAVALGSAAGGDAADYLEGRCDYPGQVFNVLDSGLSTYAVDTPARRIGEALETSEGRIIESYLVEDEEEIVQFLIEDGSIVDACWFDATPNNISEVASGKLPRLYGLDRFDSTHRNDRIPVLMEKARKVVDTIKELKEELSNLK